MRKRDHSPPKAPAAPMPGAPQTSHAGLLVGVYAICTIAGIGTLHLFDWEVRIRQSLVDVTAHGDEWEQWVALRQGWTARARGYLSRSAAASATYIGGMSDITNSPAATTFVGYSDFGSNVIFQGECLAEDITLTVPNEMVTQEVTIRGTVAPTTGPAA